MGKYSDGELDGAWEWWRQSGEPSLQAGAFEGGKQVGLWKRYYDNGQLWDEGRYDRGKKIGEWRIFAKDGALKQSKVFKPKK
jgi:antitoxin component YwqK of YwqJK toxin-antitoxin module